MCDEVDRICLMEEKMCVSEKMTLAFSFALLKHTYYSFSFNCYAEIPTRKCSISDHNNINVISYNLQKIESREHCYMI